MAENPVGTQLNEAAPPLTFPSKITQPCSWNECLSGHRWPITALLSQCPGCGSTTLALKLENCPYCNEPIARNSLRSDFVTGGVGIAPRCKGATVFGESVDLTLKREFWAEAQDNHLTFLGKQAKEEAAKR